MPGREVSAQNMEEKSREMSAGEMSGREMSAQNTKEKRREMSA